MRPTYVCLSLLSVVHASTEPPPPYSAVMEDRQVLPREHTASEQQTYAAKKQMPYSRRNNDLNWLQRKQFYVWRYCAYVLKLVDHGAVSLLECFVAFEVLAAVVMKSSIFWDIKTCSSLKVNRRFGGIYRLHL
jgi:hypothetical protein